MMTEKYAISEDLDEIVGSNQEEKQRGDNANPENLGGFNIE
jgi:hypothetical protein